MPNYSRLFSPLDTGAIRLPNRVIMAPLTRNRAGAGNVPTAVNAVYYGQRAAAGLIVSEATQICPEGQGYPGTPGIHSDAQVEGWRGVTQAVHERGGRIFLQLWHVGRISHPSLQPGGALPVAPSAIRPEGMTFAGSAQVPFVTPRALETDEIPGIVARYAEAAVRARDAGFDGVEIHGANGYLIDQFLRDGSNHRMDAYGGTLENRMRFLREVTEAVCAAWTPGRVGVRLSPRNPFNSMSDSNPSATFTAAAKVLDAFGLSYLHVMEPIEDGVRPKAGGERITPAMRTVFQGPLIANGSYTGDTAERAIETGAADAIAFGVLFLANPDLPKRLAIAAPLNRPDVSTFYGGGERGYIDYPALEA